MKSKNTYFEYAQLLDRQYSTINSTDTVKRNIIKTFQGEITSDYFVQHNLSPREFVNDLILNHYPNETTIKSSFINNVLFKTDNHVTIFELNVGNSRVDLCKINMRSVAYEIKTEFDTPQRLQSQMEDYLKVFEYVYLICSEKKLNSMLTVLPDNCGIYTYYKTRTGRYIFKEKRKPKISKELSSDNQLLALTKKDLKYYYNCPYFEKKEDMINDIKDRNNESYINKVFKKCLKDKYRKKWIFLVNNKSNILEIDYQWFYKHLLPPKIVYS